MIHRKNPQADLRVTYMFYVEIGLVAALGLCLVAFRLDWHPSQGEMDIVQQEQEIIQMEEVLQTHQEAQPPPPPRPSVLVEVPDDVLLEEAVLNLDASLDIDEAAADLPAPPVEPPPQETEEPEPEIFVVVEEMPQLIGGLAAIQRSIVYPEIAKKAGVEGRVIIQFIVDEQGRVTDPVVVRGIGAGCDEEALRAVGQAQFEPGKQRGKPVRVKMSVPVMFRLN